MAIKKFQNVVTFSTMSPDLYSAMEQYKTNCILERKGSTNAFASRAKSEMEDLINKEYVFELKKRAGNAGLKVEAFGEGKDALVRFCNSVMVKEFANAIKDDMIDMILADVLMTGALSYFADFRTADFGDTIKWDIENSAYFTVSEAGYRKRHTNLQKYYKATETMSGVNHEVTVGADLFEIMIGQASIAKDVMKVAVSIEAQMFNEAYDAFTVQANALTGNLAVANYTENSLIKLCQTITAFNGNRKAVIMGTPVALKAVLPTNANYRYALDSEYVKLGHLQTFNGYDVIPMEQYADYTSSDYSLKLDDTKIYVVSPASDKIVKIGLFGGTISRADGVNDNANKMLLSTVEKAWEVKVITNSVGGVVKALS